MTEDNEDDFSPKKDYAFYSKRVKLKVNNVNAERPKVNKVLFMVPDFLKGKIPSGYVSYKPRTTYTVEEEDEEGDIMESTHERRYYKDELPEKIRKLLDASKVLGEDELLRIEGTITESGNSNEDMDYDTYWFINPNHWDTIQASKVSMQEAIEDSQEDIEETEEDEEAEEEQGEGGEDSNEIL